MNRALFLVGVVAACHGKPPEPIVHLATTSVDTPNVSTSPAIVELGDTTFVLDDAGIAVMRGGVVVARGACPSIAHDKGACPWREAASIAAPTGEGRWAVAILGDSLVHVTIGAEYELVDQRFGLHAVPTLIAAAGRTFVIASAHEVAVTRDGMTLSHFDRDVTAVAAARDRVALALRDHVEVWNLAAMTVRSIPLPATSLAFVDADTDHSRLAIAGARAVFVETGDGDVARLATAPPEVDRLVASGSRLWLDARGTLFVDDAGVVSPTDLPAAPATAIFAATSGAAWVSRASKLARVAVGAQTDDPGWQATIAPVFGRVCAHCHVPGGSAGIDLSSPASWKGEHDEIKRRVMVTQTMPPAGTTMSDDDRRAIEAWLAHAP